jgi:hypothetical protein
MPAGQPFFSAGAGVATGTVVGAALGVALAIGSAGIVVGAALGAVVGAALGAGGGAIGSGFPEHAARARAVERKAAGRAIERIDREPTGIHGARKGGPPIHHLRNTAVDPRRRSRYAGAMRASRAVLALLLPVAITAACSSTPSSPTTTGSGGGSSVTTSSSTSGQGGASTSDGPSTSSGSGGSGGSGGSVPWACPGDEPDETNTGVPVGVALKVVNQDVVVTQDGTVIDAQDIHGFLEIQASHVKVTRSIVRGHATAATTAIIRIKSGTDILIEDTEIAASAPSVDVDGFSGGDFTGRRLNIHGGVDGMKLGSNSTVECSYIHDLAAFASDPNQNGGPTHNDAIQILAGTGIHIVGNQLLAATDDNSAIQITEDFGAVSDVHIESNWADGGGCTFNFSHKGATALKKLFTSGNRFGRNSFFKCPILKSTKTTLVSMGDVWDDDSTEVPIQTHD